MQEPLPLTERHLDDLLGSVLFVFIYFFVEDSVGSFVVPIVVLLLYLWLLRSLGSWPALSPTYLRLS